MPSGLVDTALQRFAAVYKSAVINPAGAYAPIDEPGNVTNANSPNRYVAGIRAVMGPNPLPGTSRFGLPRWGLLHTCQVQLGARVVNTALETDWGPRCLRRLLSMTM